MRPEAGVQVPFRYVRAITADVRVLVAEDERALAEQLGSALTAAGYAVDCAADGAGADFLARTETYDAVLLDLGLPGVDGLTLLRSWREAGLDVPVLVLTARGSWSERVLGIDSGADDYLPKPYRIEEVLARVRALIRRAHGHAQPELRCGDVTLDPSPRAGHRAWHRRCAHQPRVPVARLPDASPRARRLAASAHRTHLRAAMRSRFEHAGSVRRTAAPQAGRLGHRDGARPRLSRDRRRRGAGIRARERLGLVPLAAPRRLHPLDRRRDAGRLRRARGVPGQSPATPPHALSTGSSPCLLS